ncbi:hypothetical protein [Shewanella sp. GXUN23E]|uniref:hypothetical protein n=1 Tax=Shewanella sp. GXUN23E TaxID=3422498 RepID=UPI003D7E6067
MNFRFGITLATRLFGALLLLPITVLAADTAELQGSWELVSGRYLDGNGQWVEYQSLGLEAIKVVADGHFSFTTVAPDKKGKGTKLWAAGSGHFELDGDHYVEYPTLNSFNVPKGQGFRFHIQLQGDEWRTQRIENGVLKEEEVWRRIRAANLPTAAQ